MIVREFNAHGQIFDVPVQFVIGALTFEIIVTASIKVFHQFQLMEYPPTGINSLVKHRKILPN
jgi:hypothetical protein